MSRRVWATVNLSALRDNARTARAAAPRSRIMAVVKSDAYGHGMVPAATALAPETDAFAVTCVEEAAVLREAGFRQPIVLLEGPFAAEDLESAAALGLEPVLHTEWQVEALARARLSAPVAPWIKVDTGMHRLGFPPEAVGEVWRRLHGAPSVQPQIGFMTHLACADDRADTATQRQLAVFDEACAGLPGPRSAANSAGVLGWPGGHFDWIRPGIMLYGASPFIDGRGGHQPLAPVMTLEGRLIAVNHYRAGDALGYGATWRCPEPMPVGVISVGYGDGYPRHAPSGTPVLVDGVRTALVGRVSMDMLCVDLRGHPGVAVGAPATLWGDGLPAEEVAGAAGTISYELFCRTTPRARRRYVGAAQTEVT